MKEIHTIWPLDSHNHKTPRSKLAKMVEMGKNEEMMEYFGKLLKIGFGDSYLDALSSEFPEVGSRHCGGVKKVIQSKKQL